MNDPLQGDLFNQPPPEPKKEPPEWNFKKQGLPDAEERRKMLEAREVPPYGPDKPEWYKELPF